MRFLRLITIIFVVAIVSFSCHTMRYGYPPRSSVVVGGKVRPAIEVDSVIIYFEPPSQYEIIGKLMACCSNAGSPQKEQDRVFNGLKERAAGIGANGVLLYEDEDVMRMGDGTVIIKKKEDSFARGWAIYVFKEEPIKETGRDTTPLPEENSGAAAPPDSAKEEVEASP